MTYLVLFLGLSFGTLLGWILCAVLVKNRALPDGAGPRNRRSGRFSDLEPPAESQDHRTA